ncbi:hypothetical protein BH09ACT8_BH09ACT8_27080 [soil metagenome]
MESTAEYDLAWDLAAAVDATLTAADRADVFAKIGAGETYGAIEQLLSCADALASPLGTDLLTRSGAWLNAYRGCDAEARLRALLGRLGELHGAS